MQGSNLITLQFKILSDQQYSPIYSKIGGESQTLKSGTNLF
jgi:hypothetical protein